MKQVLRDVNILVNDVDLSNHFTAITVEDSAAEVDSTAFGSNYTQAMKGLRTAQITGTVQQDFEAASVHDTLNELNNQDEPFEVLVTPTTGAISATNPGFRLTESQLLGYTPLAGGVGDLSTTDVTFTNAGDLGVEVLTAPPGP